MILNILNTYYLQRNICDNDRTAKFKDIEPGIVISNTGSSHGLYGFNYEELGEEYNCFNFALESQRLSYDYRIVSLSYFVPFLNYFLLQARFNIFLFYLWNG